ncbi:thiamine pyrophosphate-dependent dehydrogenase E1 component subunit alpha [Halorarum halophilum]|uniref:Thiamine pyrophosphate-dependent dehydrogenase E1 component subunit alpha n=1 Tax=Halorarum halophilum TaxID=2743090 RepID=A0A7D5GDX1_9EURY|nr:thiamine pyrophosphate-dependent dehydrogenase E1 component subunit alpha [Halobaculum halophilum]QLG29285.1 thiamine pyrophosphate-dependent dehydrogenase E1 component subunit alpha [Halobaculum halophilum]
MTGRDGADAPEDRRADTSGQTAADADDPMGEVYRVLDADGVPVRTVPDIVDGVLLDIYRDMRTARRFDERAVSLQRQGRIGTFASIAGQEAVSVAATHALREDDPVFYQYREHGAVIARGFPPGYLSFWMGHEEGTAALADIDVFPLAIGIASHIPHAVGAAMAFDYRGEDRVSATFFGDGATSEGDFHEALNFAGVFDTPSVFFCTNNQWAISVPSDRQTASESYAAKAEAYGFEGVRVDGMDPLAVYDAARRAAAKAREGGTPHEGADDGVDHRPTLIETVAYRFGAHTTADDPSVYRDEAELERWRRWDPLPRFEAFLRGRGLLDDERIDAIADEVEERVAEVIEAGEGVEPDPASMFEHVYDRPTPELREQRDALLDSIQRHGHEAFDREE